MAKVVTIQEMIEIERRAIEEGLATEESLIQLAGMSLSHHLITLIDGLELDGFAILFLIGTGKNGGDGLVAAATLKSMFPEEDIAAYFFKARSADDPLVQTAEEIGVEIIKASKDSKEDYETLRGYVSSCDILVDAMFGTGVKIPIEGNAAEVMRIVRQTLAELGNENPQGVITCPTLPDRPQFGVPFIVAVDCPSGVNCDTGEIDPNTIRAITTVTFGAAKYGQLRFPAADYVGQLHIGGLGLDTFAPLMEVKTQLADGPLVAELLPERSRQSHKGTFGKVMIVGGSANYIGAPALAAQAAYRSGVGLVTLAAPQMLVPILAAQMVETTWLMLPHELGVLHENAVDILRKELNGYDVMVLGCGLGQEDPTQRFIEKFFTLTKPEKTKGRTKGLGFIHPSAGTPSAEETESEEVLLPRMVVDADGLNLLSKLENWWTLLPDETVLTPHEGEFKRLAGIEEIGEKRLELAREYAAKWNKVVVLKGAFTVIAAPNGNTTLMPFATSAMATAGTGDVLAGLIGGFMGQGISAYHAAIIGAWVQGCAATISETTLGTARAVMAGDIVGYLSAAIAQAESLRKRGYRFQ